MEMEIEMEMEIGTGLGLAGQVCLTDWPDWAGLSRTGPGLGGLDWTGPDRTGLTDCLDRSGLDRTGLEPCGWTGLGWDLAAWRPRDLEKAEQHSVGCKHTTNSSHRIKMDTC